MNNDNDTTTRTETMTKPTLFCMIGGPGSGKSYVRTNDPTLADLPVVDSDQWKESHPDYDPKNPSALHAWSSEQMTKQFFGMLAGSESFVYDGTGTNAEKMVDWIMRAQSAGFRVELVYVRCPLNTALERNANRTRVVPESVVREKHEVVETSFRISRGYADAARIVDNG